MKPATAQTPKPAFRNSRTELLADLLLDEVDDDLADLDDDLLQGVGLRGHGRAGFGAFGGDDGATLWR
ncbi:MAG: hypothetical protein JNN03_19295 [Rubrivivax sp.]|nr:hypothetical protein [Rubrivivax sp.]